MNSSQMIARRPVSALALGFYIGFCAVSILCLLLKTAPGEILLFAWPYPLLLSMQDWIAPDTWWSLLGAYIFGGGVVLSVASLVQRAFGPSRPRGVLLVFMGLILSTTPVLLEVVVQRFLPGGE